MTTKEAQKVRRYLNRGYRVTVFVRHDSFDISEINKDEEDPKVYIFSGQYYNEPHTEIHPDQVWIEKVEQINWQK